MNLQVFLDLTYNPCKNFKVYSLQGKNVQIFLVFTYTQGKIFLILPITRGGGGGTYIPGLIPGLHWELQVKQSRKFDRKNSKIGQA